MLHDLQPPYVVVIFASKRNQNDVDYHETNDHLQTEAEKLPGYLGLSSYRLPDGRGVSNVYWRDRESLEVWRKHREHNSAKVRGRAEWYDAYHVEIADVSETYGMLPSGERYRRTAEKPSI